MNQAEGLQQVQAELDIGIALAKCQVCGCMEGALINLAAVLPSQGTDDTAALAAKLAAYREKMRPIQYACLGCNVCYPATAQNVFGLAFPTLAAATMYLTCEFRVREEVWPPVVGEYFVLDPAGSVAVSTLASVQLAEEIAQRKPTGLAIVGKTETENIGIDKVIKNIVSSPTLRYLIVAGADAQGHRPGETLLAIAKHAVDEQGHVLGSTGRRPILRNVSAAEIQAFRTQVQVVDMVGCEDPVAISAKVEEYAQQAPVACGCSECSGKTPLVIAPGSKLIAEEPYESAKLDRAGYFVIVPVASQGLINLEYYSYDNALLQTVEGVTARAIYRTIIDQGWVTELSHAAYLGKELAKAELALQYGFKYIQDGA